MVHIYRAAVYLVMVGAAFLLYLLLRRLSGRGNRVVPAAAALLAAAGLVWCAHFALSKPALLRKYAPLLYIKKEGTQLNMVYMESEVRICNPDGADDRLFLPQDFITTRDISWSPDGTRLLCCRVRDSREGMNVFSYDFNGENPVQVTSGPGIARRPSWSPDGTRIVFDFRPNLRRVVTDIVVINADGSGRRVLLDGDRLHAYHPVWSPDGGSIYCCVKQGRTSDIWVMDTDGGDLRQLTFTPEIAETEPDLSPDGSRIVFSVNRREIHLMDADGGHRRPLTDEEGRACRGRDPSWSPDGRYILYAGFGSDNARRTIKVIDLDGGGLRVIDVPDGKLLNPVMSRDGSRLVYLRFVKSVVRKVDFPGQQPGGPGLLAGGED